MNNDVLHYTPFVTTLCSFLLAQLIKPFVAMVLSPHRFDYKRMFSTGGMPSSHTAGVITLCTTMGLTYGFASPYFVISGTFAGIVIHDAFDPDSNVKIGVLPSGADLVIDRVAVDTDLLVSEGFIEPHFFAGFSGGRKSVLPGVCDAVTVMGNHCSKFIASPNARTGILEGNPLHIDMVDAARQAKLAYIVNVVIDEDKRVIAAFAGDPFAAHEAGTQFLAKGCSVKAAPADIVITGNGGAPLDQNMYQCVKSMTAAEASAVEGGVIIECAECADGTGGEGFYRSLKDCESADALMAEILQIPQKETKPDQWEYQIQARILMHHPVIYVSRPEMRQTIEDMKMMYAETIDEAIAMAREIRGQDATFTVIPNGISVIVQS